MTLASGHSTPRRQSTRLSGSPGLSLERPDSEEPPGEADIENVWSRLQEMAWPLPPSVGPTAPEPRLLTLELRRLRRAVVVKDQAGQVVLTGRQRGFAPSRHWAFAPPAGGPFELWGYTSPSEHYQWRKPSGEVFAVLRRRRERDSSRRSSVLLQADPKSAKPDVRCQWLGEGRYRVLCTDRLVLGTLARSFDVFHLTPRLSIQVNPGFDPYLMVVMGFLCIIHPEDATSGAAQPPPARP